tara:strand:- start:53 stop:718 length:666 start_codon:yes stop_codon:yes gene_type:complete
MAFFTTLGLITGAAGAIKGFIGGEQMASDARKGLEKFEYQDLSQGAFDTLKPSLEQEQFALQQIGQQRSGLVDVAAGLSASDAMSLLGAGEEQIGQKELNLLNKMIEKESQFDVMRGQDFQKRMQMQEARDQQELQTLSQQLMAGESQQAQAIQGLGQIATAYGTAEQAKFAQAGYDPLAKKKARKQKRLAGEGFLGRNTKVGGFLGDQLAKLGGFFQGLF